jgi:integrase
MLRHACGYKLANDGTDTRTIQAYLGHRSYEGFGVKGPVRIFFCFANR